MPADDDIPSTVKRSPAKARRTWKETHDSAVETYGEGERAHRTAFAALKHSFEKIGDHWEPKPSGAKGPSDAQAAETGRAARRGANTTGAASAGGVDANASKAHLLEVARRLEVRGRTRMTKAQLVEALQKANQRETARARREN